MADGVATNQHREKAVGFHAQNADERNRLDHPERSPAR